MTAKQYGILQDLFHEMSAEFHRLSDETKGEFMDILFGRKTLNQVTGRYEWLSNCLDEKRNTGDKHA